MFSNFISFFILVCCLLFFKPSFSQNGLAVSEVLKNDTLTLNNEHVSGKWLWNDGNIIPLSIDNLDTSKSIKWKGNKPSFVLANHPFVKHVLLSVKEIQKNYFEPAHIECVLINQHDELQVKRVFKLYTNTATVSTVTYIKYSELSLFKKDKEDELTGKESFYKEYEAGNNHLERYGFNSPHWSIETVSFKDVTDKNNNLVFNSSFTPYNYDITSNGNLLLGTHSLDKVGFFILKEAPNESSQLNYPGFDFVTSNKGLSIPFSGYPFQGFSKEWIEGYTTTISIGEDENSLLHNLRLYLKETSMYSEDSHEMVMMNTWGDRGRDGRINESFIVNELKTAANLGITHYQIDDGWEQGLSSNSADSSGELWDEWKPEDWQVHKTRFPNGLEPVLEEAKKYNIKLGLWFHPSNGNSYANWKQDAEIITNLYKSTGIKYIKIDGIKINDKRSEINLQKFFETVKEQTDGAVFFNLDLTAGVRGGYFKYRNLGNLFLENRYTDWGRYYPYQTLRNLWMLSKYFPPELLQIEFLNNSRNPNKYGENDLLAPHNYDFDYVFATTMAAQPLAWFEATGLPKDFLKTKELIGKYKEVKKDFHEGVILPIGEEPSGTSVTGFQSIKEDKGYLLIYRELNPNDLQFVQTYLLNDKNVKFKTILSSKDAKNVKLELLDNGVVKLNLPKENSFIMVSYSYN